jgi:hypothetical protein
MAANPKSKMTKSIDIPIGRVELLGQVLHIVEHDGHLVAACNDEHGMPFEALACEQLDGHGCRNLMRQAVDLLTEGADISLMLSDFAANRNPRLPRSKTSHAPQRDLVHTKESLVALSIVRPPG